MKTTQAMIDNVFRRKNEYEAKICARKAVVTKVVAYGCCACLVLALLVGVGTVGFVDRTEYTILIDVNPSVAVTVDADETIVNVTDLNEDAAAVIQGKTFVGKELTGGVGDLVEEMVQDGYISSESNSVLVTVGGADDETSQRIKTELTDKISATLSENNVEGAIIAQDLPEDDAQLQQVSAEFGISPGKSQLIAQIIAQNGFHRYEELSKMTIHELNLLRESYYIHLKDGQVSGEPSRKAYIGEQTAAQIALSDANETVTATVTLECRTGAMQYCVGFETDVMEYRYRINAVTGEILSAESSEWGENDFFVGDTPIATVGENAALEAALAHAGMQNSALIRCKYRSDWVDNTVVYDLYFTDGRRSCFYVIDARTGEIIRYGQMQEERDRSVDAVLIGEAEAKCIALSQDGLVDGNVTKYEMVLQSDSESYVYELSYICNATKYTVQINAADGTVMQFEKQSIKDSGTPSVESGDGDGDKAPADGDGDKAPAEGDGDKAPAEGDGDKAPADGDGDKAPADGDGDKAPADGDGDKAPADGDGDKAPADGDGDKAPAEGDGDKAPTDGDGDKAPADGDGDKAPADGDGDKAPADGDGDKAPADGDGDKAPADGDGDKAPADGDGDKAPAEGDGDKAPADGDGDKAPADGDGDKAPADGDGDKAPADGDGDKAPADGDGDKAPADGDGDKAPADGDGDKAPADGDGDKAPADGDGDKAPADGDGDKAPADGDGDNAFDFHV